MGDPTAQQLISSASQPANVQTSDPTPANNNNIQTQSPQALQNTTQDDNPHQGFLSKVSGAFMHPMQTLSTVGHDLVQAGGRPAPNYEVDANGVVDNVNAGANATPGTLFKNLLIGALTGMSAGAKNPRGGFLGHMGTGFTGAMDAAEERNQQNEANAMRQEQLKIESQKAADDHSDHLMNQAVQARLTAESNVRMANETLELWMKPLEEQNKVLDLNRGELDNISKQPGGDVVFSNLSAEDAMKYLTNDPKLAHTTIAAATGTALPQMVTDENGNTIEIEATGRQLPLGPDGKPLPLWNNVTVKNPDGTTSVKQELNKDAIMGSYTYTAVRVPPKVTLTKDFVSDLVAHHVLPPGTQDFQPGMKISSTSWLSLSNQLRQSRSNDLKDQAAQAEIKARSAEADRAFTEIKKLTGDIKDANQQRDAEQTYQDAVKYNNMDTSNKAGIIQLMTGSTVGPVDAQIVAQFQKEHPNAKSDYSYMAAKENQNVAANTETVTDNTGGIKQTKTISKGTRLLTYDPKDLQPRVGPDGKRQLAPGTVLMADKNGTVGPVPISKTADATRAGYVKANPQQLQQWQNSGNSNPTGVPTMYAPRS